MSVSLTHVQPALQNHVSSGASGPLTLNVLHRTDALLKQLSAFDAAKPVSVEVLKTLPNGRAEVRAGGLTLDVKASLPLKIGEIFHLRLEQTGAQVRFVQPVGQAASGQVSGSAVNGQIPAQAQTLALAQAANQASVQSSVQSSIQAPIQSSIQSSIQAQITASALVGIVAETLPGLVKKNESRDTTGKTELNGATKNSGVSLDPATRSNQILNSLTLQAKQTAAEVNAKYQQLSSAPVEEILDVAHKPLTKSADITIELPLHGADKPVLIQLHIGPDSEGEAFDEEQALHGVRFSLETEETGAVHAAVGLFGSSVRVTLWAEQVEFADLLEAQRMALDERLAATGLNLSAVQIRRGRPLTAQLKQQAHLDAEV